jgi:hypothetical protein
MPKMVIAFDSIILAVSYCNEWWCKKFILIVMEQNQVRVIQMRLTGTNGMAIYNGTTNLVLRQLCTILVQHKW